jgi:hypothetical protein
MFLLLQQYGLVLDNLRNLETFNIYDESEGDWRVGLTSICFL